jgi:hypothetical protein
MNRRSNVTTRKFPTTYCTLYRIGYWASFDAKCETETRAYGASAVPTHTVEFALIGMFGEVTKMGLRLFSQYGVDSPTVIDESGEDFPDLDAAIRAHAASLVRITAMPGLRVFRALRHDLWDRSARTAFEPETAA